MKWVCETARCLRRFALFPKKLYDSNKMQSFVVWLEFYYIIQTRNGGFDEWRFSSLTTKEVWQKWRDEQGG